MILFAAPWTSSHPRQKVRIFLLALIFTMILPAAWASNGEGRGGGGVFIPNPSKNPPQAHVALLDLVLHKRYRFENDLPDPKEQLDIENDFIFQVVGYKQLTLTELKIYPLVNERLALWKAGSPVFISYMERALKALPQFTFTRAPIGLAIPDARFSIPRSLRGKGRVEAAIHYVSEYDPIVSLQLWEQTGPLSWAGFVIHEALRHIQLSYGFEDLDDENLQRLTAMLLLDDPSKFKSLDKGQFFNGRLKKRIQREASSENGRLKLGVTLCARLRESGSRPVTPPYGLAVKPYKDIFCMAEKGAAPSLDDFENFYAELKEQLTPLIALLSDKKIEDFKKDPSLRDNELIKKWDQASFEDIMSYLFDIKNSVLLEKDFSLHERVGNFSNAVLNLKDLSKVLRHSSVARYETAISVDPSWDREIYAAWNHSQRAAYEKRLKHYIIELRKLLGLTTTDLDSNEWERRFRYGRELKSKQMQSSNHWFQEPVYNASRLAQLERETVEVVCQSLGREMNRLKGIEEATDLVSHYDKYCTGANAISLPLDDNAWEHFQSSVEQLNIQSMEWLVNRIQDLTPPLGDSSPRPSVDEQMLRINEITAEWKQRPIGEDSIQKSLAEATEALMRYRFTRNRHKKVYDSSR